MTHAELLRKDAELAMREGGMYYSGECLSRMASVAESLEAENAKLREQIDAAHMSRLLTENENELLRELLIDVSEEVPWSFMDTTKYCMPLRADKLRKLLCRMRELGVEVNE